MDLGGLFIILKLAANRERFRFLAILFPAGMSIGQPQRIAKIKQQQGLGILSRYVQRVGVLLLANGQAGVVFRENCPAIRSRSAAIAAEFL